MPSAGFEPANPASKWPQTYALDRAATGISYTTYQSKAKQSKAVPLHAMVAFGRRGSIAPTHS
jgi:hypothetical protein